MLPYFRQFIARARSGYSKGIAQITFDNTFQGGGLEELWQSCGNGMHGACFRKLFFSLLEANLNLDPLYTQ